MIFPWGNAGGVEGFAVHLIPTLPRLRSGCTSSHPASRATPVNSAWTEFPGLPGTGVGPVPFPHLGPPHRAWGQSQTGG